MLWRVVLTCVLNVVVLCSTSEAQLSPIPGVGASGSGTIASVAGTAAEITVQTVGGAVTISIPSSVTYTGKTITGGTYASPILSGSVTGTYTLAGTPTITAPILSGSIRRPCECCGGRRRVGVVGTPKPRRPEYVGRQYRRHGLSTD